MQHFLFTKITAFYLLIFVVCLELRIDILDECSVVLLFSFYSALYFDATL